MNDQMVNEAEKNVSRNTKTFFIAGVQHHQMHKVLKDMVVGDTLALVPEPTNKYDPNAIGIIYARFDKETMCGYVPMKFSSEVTAMLEVGLNLECVITEFDATAKPWEQCKVTIQEVSDIEKAGPDIGDGPDYDSGCKEDN